MTTPNYGAERRNVPCTIALPREDLVELERLAEESGRSQMYGRTPTYADMVRKAVRELIGRARDAKAAAKSSATSSSTSSKPARKVARKGGRR